MDIAIPKLLNVQRPLSLTVTVNCFGGAKILSAVMHEITSSQLSRAEMFNERQYILIICATVLIYTNSIQMASTEESR